MHFQSVSANTEGLGCTAARSRAQGALDNFTQSVSPAITNWCAARAWLQLPQCCVLHHRLMNTVPRQYSRLYHMVD